MLRPGLADEPHGGLHVLGRISTHLPLRRTSGRAATRALELLERERRVTDGDLPAVTDQRVQADGRRRRAPGVAALGPRRRVTFSLSTIIRAPQPDARSGWSHHAGARP